MNQMKTLIDNLYNHIHKDTSIELPEEINLKINDHEIKYNVLSFNDIDEAFDVAGFEEYCPIEGIKTPIILLSNNYYGNVVLYITDTEITFESDLYLKEIDITDIDNSEIILSAIENFFENFLN